MKNSPAPLPQEGKHPLRCKDACAKCWGCVQLVGNHVWPSHALLGSELGNRTAAMRAVLGCTKQKGRFQCCLQDVQEAKSRCGSLRGEGRKLTRPFYILAYIFSVAVFFVHCKTIFHSALEISGVSKTH